MKDLDNTWKLCIKMWKWVSENYAGEEWDEVYDLCDKVLDLKEKWMVDHNIEEIESNCFFCEWAEQVREEFDIKGDTYCCVCPGRLIDPKFDCYADNYHYKHNPQAFYEKICKLYEDN